MRQYQSSRSMRTVVALLLCIVLTFGSVPVALMEGETRIVTAATVNVRSAAGADSSVLITATQGDVGNFIAEQGGWTLLEINGVTGYIRSDLLKLGQATANSAQGLAATPVDLSANTTTTTAAPATTAAAGVTPISAEAAVGSAIVTGSIVNIRASASASASVLTSVQKGSTVTVLGVSGDWSRVSYSGISGYIMTQYLNLAAVNVVNGSTTAVQDMDAAGAINVNGLNVRSEASTSAAKLYSLSSGTAVNVTGKLGDWYRIDTAQGVGFVLGKYVTLGSTAATTDSAASQLVALSGTGTISGSGVNVRAAANTTSASLFKLSNGAEVTIKGKQDTWYFIAHAAGEGYVREDFINVRAASNGVLQFGDQGESVKSVQQRLIELGYLTEEATGHFGAKTMDAVRAFQQKVNLNPDGVVGATTLVALNATGAPVYATVTTGAASAVTLNSNAVLKQGDSGTAVTAIQQRLIELSYLSASATGTFGPQTAEAVKLFQARAGLSADGIVGATTLSALNAATAPVYTVSSYAGTVLQPGDTSEQVTRLQQRLQELGYLATQPTGNYGQQTEAAVKAFQIVAGMSADGVAGELTLSAVYADTAPSFSGDIVEDDSISTGATISQGDSGSAVSALQKRLQTLGYFDSSVYGNYGAVTVTAVKAFQTRAGLTATGSADHATQQRLFADDAPINNASSANSSSASLTQSLKEGDSGNAVRALQTRLTELGYFNHTLSDSFSAVTKAAVIAFQIRAGLTADGIVGAATLRALNASDAPSASTSTGTDATPTTAPTSLSQGDTGDAVKALQERLQKLGYLAAAADGNFGASTRSAVAAFQLRANLTSDGVANQATLTALYSDSAPLVNDDVTSSDAQQQPTTQTRTLEMGVTGADVTQLQQRLYSLGYMVASADGEFGAQTRDAVMLYQKQARLTSDGKAGAKTLESIYADSAQKYDGKTTLNQSSGSPEPLADKVEQADWWKSDIQSIFARGDIATVTDVRTGLTWQVKRRGGSNHADVEPLTAADTANMKQAYGGSWSWARRSIWVTIDGHTYAASMNGMPHGSQAITNNNFSGHHCIHFLNSRTHTGNRWDTDHQNAVQYAYEKGNK